MKDNLVPFVKYTLKDDHYLAIDNVIGELETMGDEENNQAMVILSRIANYETLTLEEASIVSEWHGGLSRPYWSSNEEIIEVLERVGWDYDVNIRPFMPREILTQKIVFPDINF